MSLHKDVSVQVWARAFYKILQKFVASGESRRRSGKNRGDWGNSR